MSSASPGSRRLPALVTRLREPAVPGGRSSRYRLILSAIFVVAGVLLFIRVWDWWTEREDLSRWDIPVMTWLVQHRDPLLTGVLEVVTTITAPTGMIIVSMVTVVAWMLRSRHWWRPLLLAAAMAVAVGCIVGIKSVAGRGRPPVADMLMGADVSYSFPSGHTLGTATFLSVLVYLLFFRPAPSLPQPSTGPESAAAPSSVKQPTRGRWVAVTGAVLLVAVVAFSRLYLGYHWLTDVTASVLLASAILGLVIGIDMWRPTSRHPRPPAPAAQ